MESSYPSKNHKKELKQNLYYSKFISLLFTKRMITNWKINGEKYMYTLKLYIFYVTLLCNFVKFAQYWNKIISLMNANSIMDVDVSFSLHKMSDYFRVSSPCGSV